MKIKLSEWASIAEILSGLAVVITLIVLIGGIRENTEIAQSAAYDRNIDSINDISMSLAQDKELTRLYQMYVQGELDEMDSEGWFRVGLVVQSVLRTYEKAYFANQVGNLGLAEWSRFESMICTQRSRLNTPRWDGIRLVLTEEFTSYIKGSCSDAQ